MPTWRWDWPHLAAMRTLLQHAVDGALDRLWIFAPPRHGKSEQNTIRFAAWLLEADPTTRIIVGAYNQTLAEKFSRRIRRLLTERGRVALTADRKAVGEWELIAGGGLRAAGVGSGITGMGADWILIDDPVKSREEAESEAYRERCWDWFKDDVSTRLEPGGRIVGTMTRWHEDDLAGRCLREMPGEWTVLNLPALAEPDDPLGRPLEAALCPDRYDQAALRRIKKLQGRSFYALYQGRPQPHEGGAFKRAWFRARWSEPPARERLTLIVQSWDCATKAKERSSYSVCETWGVTREGRPHLLDVWRDRVEYPDLEDACWAQATLHSPQAVLIEDKGNGSALLQSVRRGRRAQAADADGPARSARPALPAIAIEPHGDKVMRADAVSPLCEAGLVVLPASAPWLEDWLDEHVHFPTGAFADQVDATSQFLAWWHARAGDATPSVAHRPRAADVGPLAPRTGRAKPPRMGML